MSERMIDERLKEMVTLRGAMPAATLTELLSLADEVYERRSSRALTAVYESVAAAVRELESVRESLMLLASIVAFTEYEVSSVDILRRCGLSESVIDWATTPTVNP